MEGWGWQSVHDPDELPKVLERWRESIRTGEAFEMDFRFEAATASSSGFSPASFRVRDAQVTVTRSVWHQHRHHVYSRDA